MKVFPRKFLESIFSKNFLNMLQSDKKVLVLAKNVKRFSRKECIVKIFGNYVFETSLVNEMEVRRSICSFERMDGKKGANI